MRYRRFFNCFVACLSLWAAGRALTARAQSDTFGGDPSTNAFIRIPKDTDDWTRHFRLGAMVGLNIKANFSMSGNFNVSGNNPAAGNFADGYIHKDQSGDPNSTANWGYTSAGQISGNGSVLALGGASSFTASGKSESDGGLQAGIDMAYGGNLWYWKHARVGWEFGFGWLPIDISASSTYKGTVTQSTNFYNISGITVPGAPYSGGPSGIGPSIPLTPIGHTNSAGTSGSVSGTHELDVDLYTIRLGPSFYWDISRRLGLSVGAGPAVGFVYGQYKYNESVTQAGGTPTPNSGQVTGEDFVYGGYVNATLMYHWENHGDFYLGAQYMPMSDATISGGGRQGQLDLEGQVYISAGINWPF